MQRDLSLVPTESIRLAALGLLAESERAYGHLAIEVRHLTSRLSGPSLDLLGPSLELLRYEGLVESASVSADPARMLTAETMLRLTEAGRAALVELLTAPVRTPVNDPARLAIRMKLRFLHHLEPATRGREIEHLIEIISGETARLADLRTTLGDSAPYLSEWLDQEVTHAEGRLAWLRDRLAEL